MTRFAAIKYITPNIGDDFQTLAALQHLPRPVRLISRERLDRVWNLFGPQLRTICNGWFMYRPERWPPSSAIDPLIIAFHLTKRIVRSNRRKLDPHAILLAGRNREYFLEQVKRNGVGTRDMATLRAFHEAGIDAYFSGCLTMTIQPPSAVVRTETIYAVDLSPEALAALRSRTRGPIVALSHQVPRHMWRRKREARLAELHRIYASARAVVTTRLHVSLPCLAMGTPVMMIHANPLDPRFEGLIEHLHFVPEVDFIAGRYSYSHDNPPPNPETFHPLAESMRRRCRTFVNETSAVETSLTQP